MNHIKTFMNATLWNNTERLVGPIVEGYMDASPFKSNPDQFRGRLTKPTDCLPLLSITALSRVPTAPRQFGEFDAHRV
jgi:hypothetical protein